MEANEAKKTVSEITTDILESRGDMGLSQVRKWTGAYSYWADACEVLTAQEIDDAMWDGLRAYTDSLADAHEDADFEGYAAR